MEQHLKRVPSSTSHLAREAKSVPGFRVSKDRLTLLLGANADGVWIEANAVYHGEHPGALKLRLSLLGLCSVSGTTKAEWEHKYLQHGLMNILSLLLKLSAQIKCFKILLIIDNAPCHPRALMEMYNKINIIHLPANNIHSISHGSRSHFDFQVLLFDKHIY